MIIWQSLLNCWFRLTSHLLLTKLMHKFIILRNKCSKIYRHTHTHAHTLNIKQALGVFFFLFAVIQFDRFFRQADFICDERSCMHCELVRQQLLDQCELLFFIIAYNNSAALIGYAAYDPLIWPCWVDGNNCFCWFCFWQSWIRYDKLRRAVLYIYINIYLPYMTVYR